MLLRVLPRTTYRSQSPVDMAQHMLHLSPVDTPTQQVRFHSLSIAPRPAARSQTRDVFGNLRTFFSQQAPHDTLVVQADSTVQTRVPQPLPEGAPWRGMTWERVREHFRYRAHAPYDPAGEFLFASPNVPRDDTFATWARPAFAPGAPLLVAAPMSGHFLALRTQDHLLPVALHHDGMMRPAHRHRVVVAVKAHQRSTASRPAGDRCMAMPRGSCGCTARRVARPVTGVATRGAWGFTNCWSAMTTYVI